MICFRILHVGLKVDRVYDDYFSVIKIGVEINVIILK